MLTVGDVMTRDPVTVAMDDSLKVIREIFEESRFHHLLVTASNISVDEASVYLLHKRVTCLPVVDGDYQIEGIVTWRDLLTHCTFCKQSQSDAA